jgi:hypothetical protein
MQDLVNLEAGIGPSAFLIIEKLRNIAIFVEIPPVSD